MNNGPVAWVSIPFRFAGRSQVTTPAAVRKVEPEGGGSFLWRLPRSAHEDHGCHVVRDLILPPQPVFGVLVMVGIRCLPCFPDHMRIIIGAVIFLYGMYRFLIGYYRRRRYEEAHVIGLWICAGLLLSGAPVSRDRRH
jgi:hypothetical protein